MRYKLLGLAVILLISTPFGVFAQKMSPIIIKTGKPVPSIIGSGEPFKITYQATYTDAVLIMEEQMRFNSLTLVVEDKKNKPKPASAEPESVNVEAEVVGLVIGEKFRDGSDEIGFVNVQDFAYTFMIISDQKGNYKIPSFNFVWVKKEAGTTIAEAKDKEELKEFPTKEVGISYVSSIVRPPTVDIRDEFHFVNFTTLAARVSLLAYGTIGLASLLTLITLARFYQQPRAHKTDDSKDNADNINENLIDTAMPTFSLRKARKKFFQGLQFLESEFRSVAGSNEAMSIMGKKLYQLVRTLILAELFEGPVRVSDAHTPKEICEYLAGLGDKQKKQLGRNCAAILELTSKSKSYYENIESSHRFADLEREIGELRHIVEGMNQRKRLYSGMKSIIRRAYFFAKNCVSLG